MKRSIVFLLVILFFLSVFSFASKVLVVSSYDKDYEWNRAIVESIENVFADTDVETKYFYMNTRLRTEEEWKEQSGQLALDIVNEWNPDVVIACDDNAQSYFVKLIKDNKNIQIVFCGLNKDPDEYGYPRNNITGILEKPFPLDSLNFLSDIVPDIENIAFIGDESSTTDGFIGYLNEVNYGIYKIQGYYKFETVDKLINAIKRLENSCDAFYLIRTIGILDETGNIMDSKDVIKIIMEITDKPLLGLSDYIIQDGALCGVVPSPYEHGRLAAEIALEILQENKTAEDFKMITPENGEKLVNVNSAIMEDISLPVDILNLSDRVFGVMNNEEKMVIRFLSEEVDGILSNFLDLFKTIADKYYSREGNWNLIKEDFNRLSEYFSNQPFSFPSIYLYILPDGYYYTSVRNFTGLNLRDREYFPQLTSGKEVVGALVQSRSTGKKSAVIAVPIFDRGLIKGFIGCSLYMEELNLYINKNYPFSEDKVFLALTEDGQIALTSEILYLFKNIDNFISSDFGGFMNKLSNSEKGTIAFETPTGKYLGTFYPSTQNEWKFILAEKIEDYSHITKNGEMKSTLNNVVEGIVKKVSDMENSLLNASDVISNNPRIPENIQNILMKIYNENPDVYDVSYIDEKSILKNIYPEEYEDIIGVDLSGQEQFNVLKQTKKPVWSDLFHAVEGFYSFDLEWPLFNLNSDFIGSLSVLIKNEDFFRDIFLANINNPNYEVWIMQNDGTVVYDIDTFEIGKNIFTDELYSEYYELKELCKTIIEENEGAGEYTFLQTNSETPVTKESIWTTISFHGKELKVVLTKSY